MTLPSIALLVSLFAGTSHAMECETPPDHSFESIVALRSCSAGVFRFADASMDDPALVLTNGHCIGFLDAYEVLVEEPTDREVRIYDACMGVAVETVARDVVYATMHQTDLAVLRLDETYQELLDSYGVEPLVMASAPAPVGEELAIVSGYWEYVAMCDLEGYVHGMREGPYTWSDSLRFDSACETFGGTSGSPVISRVTGEIVGVNNTGVEGGPECSANNPCEIDEDGVITTLPARAYGQQTYWMYSCLDEANQLDLDTPGCGLPRPAPVVRVPAVDVVAEEECDDDGQLDAGETGVIRVQVRNEGQVALTDLTLEVASSSPSLEVLGEPTLSVDAIAPYGDAYVEVAVAVQDDLASREDVKLDITATSAEAMQPVVTVSQPLRLHVDEREQSATLDDVESEASAWLSSYDATLSRAQWTRTVREGEGIDTVWYAQGVGEYGDQRLTSPELLVGSDPFVVRFVHRHDFETSDNTYWDGAVLEVSLDGGGTWDDATRYAADFGYGGTLTDQSGNPLSRREAFVGQSADWPEMSDATVDFGTELAGASVRLRFRVGTDAAAGAYGWEIDDVSVEGVNNAPFTSLEDDTCGEVPVEEDTPIIVVGSSGCGCASSSPAGPGGLLGLAGWMGLLALRRRRA